jgi:hypothetical protein
MKYFVLFAKNDIMQGENCKILENIVEDCKNHGTAMN